MNDLPADLTGLAPSDLQARLDEALTAFRGLNITAETDDDAVIAEGETLAEAIRTLRAEVTRRDTAVAERRARLTALSDVDTPEEPEPAPETPPPGNPGEPAPEPAPQPDPETVSPDEVTTSQGERVPVAAGARRMSPVQRAARNAPAPNVPAADGRTVTFSAAPDVPGYSNGQTLDTMDAVAEAIAARCANLPRQNLSRTGEAVQHRYGAAVIRRSGYGELVQDQGLNDHDLVWQAGLEKRLPGQSLTAAGGWCAPSETLYDLCQFETADGILSVPEINISRGGIRWTPGPNWSDIYTECGFFQTEADAIAGVCKTCCDVDCPSFTEVRLDAIGLCVKTPILTERGYPELTRRFLEGAIVAHAHKVNKYKIDKIVAAAGTPVALTNANSLMITMQQLELVALGFRYQYRLGDSINLEVVAPYWLKTLMRMDDGMRAYGDNMVTDASIDAWFSSRNLHVNWVYDYQDLVTTNRCAPVIPATVNVLIYPAGSWTAGTADIIQMDAVYDSAGLEANVYTALFLEEGLLMVQRCLHTCAYTIPICVSGRRAAMDISACLDVNLAS
jgi:hypothetical protein